MSIRGESMARAYSKARFKLNFKHSSIKYKEVRI